MPSAASGLITRQRLIDSALHFLGKGNSQVGVQELAARAGVSPGSLYNHFKDKWELFSAAAEQAQAGELVHLASIGEHFEDKPLGYLAAIIYASYRPKYDPQLTRIQMTLGPLGLVRSSAPLRAQFVAIVSERLAKLNANQDDQLDPEALFIALSGAYQNVLAYMLAEEAEPYLAYRVFWPFAKIMGYTRAEFDKAAVYAEEQAAKPRT